MSDRTFNWIPRFDERSRNFPVREVIRPVPLRNKLWRVGPILDQGQEGACVGFGWAAEAFATPTAVRLDRVKAAVPRDDQAFAQFTYQTAKKLDEYPGENYDGSSVLAGAKAMQQFGLLKEYRWAFSIQDVIDSIITKGPVVLGINWYDGMYEAPSGKLNVSGPLAGGHCIAAVGFTVASERFDGASTITLQNSWGPDWGAHGLAEIQTSQLANLLRQDGEACVPVRRSFGR
jgi:hypothetical protein